MNTELQLRAWQCLPKEARDLARQIYQYKCLVKDYNEGANDTLESLFGEHNLKSSTEPEEMLMVERKKVQQLHKDFIRDEWYERAACLDELFGDKCLPDEKLTKSKQEMEAEIAERATEALTAQWRSVEVELPENDEYVLVSYSRSYTPKYKEVAVAYFNGEDWYTQDGDHIRPTHWLPIPESPKHENK